jgi:hypothetical protein
VTGFEIDDGVLPTRLWNGTDFHVVSGTRLLGCWSNRPQLGWHLNHSKTRTSDDSSITCSRGQDEVLLTRDAHCRTRASGEHDNLIDRGGLIPHSLVRAPQSAGHAGAPPSSGNG